MEAPAVGPEHDALTEESVRADKKLDPEKVFRALLRQEGLPMPVTELRFHPIRRWRFDYAFPKYKIALEVEGGVWTRGRHTRGAGFLRDVSKYNEAALMGWLVLRTTPAGLYTAYTIGNLKRAIQLREAA